MGSDVNPIGPKPKWGEYYSKATFICAAVGELRGPPWGFEDVTSAQVRAVVDVLRPERAEPLAAWCDRCVARWRAEVVSLHPVPKGGHVPSAESEAGMTAAYFDDEGRR